MLYLSHKPEKAHSIVHSLIRGGKKIKRNLSKDNKLNKYKTGVHSGENGVRSTSQDSKNSVFKNECSAPPSIRGSLFNLELDEAETSKGDTESSAKIVDTHAAEDNVVDKPPVWKEKKHHRTRSDGPPQTVLLCTEDNQKPPTKPLKRSVSFDKDWDLDDKDLELDYNSSSNDRHNRPRENIRRSTKHLLLRAASANDVFSKDVFNKATTKSKRGHVKNARSVDSKMLNSLADFDFNHEEKDWAALSFSIDLAVEKRDAAPRQDYSPNVGAAAATDQNRNNLRPETTTICENTPCSERPSPRVRSVFIPMDDESTGIATSLDTIVCNDSTDCCPPRKNKSSAETNDLLKKAESDSKLLCKDLDDTSNHKEKMWSSLCSIDFDAEEDWGTLTLRTD